MGKVKRLASRTHRSRVSHATLQRYVVLLATRWYARRRELLKVPARLLSDTHLGVSYPGDRLGPGGEDFVVSFAQDRPCGRRALARHQEEPSYA
jgi:hypothetical protein